MKCLIVVLLLFTCQTHRSQNKVDAGPLFLIVEQGKVGYINREGNIVIPPTFRSAGEFSEGLASARINGTYGFIDRTGAFVIEPQFDFATTFSEGLAVVYKNSKPMVITKKGVEAFETAYASIEDFHHRRAQVQTKTGKTGFIDTSGKLVIDTSFTFIRPFIKGLAVAFGLNHHDHDDPEKNIKKNIETGVIDTLGQMVVPYGKYSEIEDEDQEYFRVRIDTPEMDMEKHWFVDRNGKLVMVYGGKNTWISGPMRCGMASVSLYKHWNAEKNGDSYSPSNDYEGFINLRGEIVFNDTSVQTVLPFESNRAFIKESDDTYSIIDTKGQRISRERYVDVVGNGFVNGIAMVRQGDKYGAIDTTGTYVIPPRFEHIETIGFGSGSKWLHDGLLFFYEDQHSEENFQRFYGIANKHGDILLKPTIDGFDPAGFINGLIRCGINGKSALINEQAKVVWQEPSYARTKKTNLNVDHMMRGYFLASSKPNDNDLGGFGSSGNYPRKIEDKNAFLPGILSVTVDPLLPDTIGDFNAITVFVANTSKKDIDFNAQDSRLYMKVQAKDRDGMWRDIEYLPSSWCGNSYHTLTLDVKKFWKLQTPVYEGDTKTKLRIELKYIDPADKDKRRWERKEITILSNEYDGMVNPGQFWRKPEYFPAGIMDPYVD